MNRATRLCLGFFLVLLLVLIRTYASSIYYDPLIAFFKNIHSSPPLPEFDWVGLLLHMSLRFWMNSLISLSILWLIFSNKELIQLSFVLYGALFVILMIVFMLLLKTYQPGGYMALFYVRRFLIHPLLLLVLIPGVYFFSNSK
jgi:exosortase F-associated protein